jgi:hypothetical protein
MHTQHEIPWFLGTYMFSHFQTQSAQKLHTQMAPMTSEGTNAYSTSPSRSANS